MSAILFYFVVRNHLKFKSSLIQMFHEFWKDLKNKNPFLILLMAMGQNLGRGPTGQVSFLLPFLLRGPTEGSAKGHGDHRT
jgi:hypothetical protein